MTNPSQTKSSQITTLSRCKNLLDLECSQITKFSWISNLTKYDQSKNVYIAKKKLTILD